MPLSAAPPRRRDGLAPSAGALLAAWLLARGGHPLAARALLAAAALSLALAALRPAWHRAARDALGRALTAALLAGVYALVLLPTRALLGLLRVDPLAPRRPPGPSLWVERDAKPFSPSDFERMS